MRKGTWGAERKNHAFGKFKSFINEQFSGSQTSHIALPPSDYFVSGPSPGVPIHTLAKMDFWNEGFWEEQGSLWPWRLISLWLLTTRSLSAHVQCLPYQIGLPYETGFGWFFFFSFLCPRNDYSPEVRDKEWLCILFLLDVNSSTGAHLSLISKIVSRRVTDCKFPTWSPSISYLKICVKKPV